MIPGEKSRLKGAERARAQVPPRKGSLNAPGVHAAPAFRQWRDSERRAFERTTCSSADARSSCSRRCCFERLGSSRRCSACQRLRAPRQLTRLRQDRTVLFLLHHTAGTYCGNRIFTSCFDLSFESGRAALDGHYDFGSANICARDDGSQTSAALLLRARSLLADSAFGSSSPRCIGLVDRPLTTWGFENVSFLAQFSMHQPHAISWPASVARSRAKWPCSGGCCALAAWSCVMSCV